MKSPGKRSAIFCLAVSLGLLAYTAYRAYAIPFTHDESLTYNHIMHEPFMHIISNNTEFISANNHILNTLAMKLWNAIFGPVEIGLRLHSLLAHVLYLLFTWRIVKGLRPAWLVMGGFLLLNINPYLLDFFSLARGYAMSISFMMMSLYYLQAFIYTGSQKKIVASLAAGGLAILSNFALLTYFLSLIVFYELYLLYSYWPVTRNILVIVKKNIPVLIAVGVMTAICWEPIRILLKTNQLYFGGEYGFWFNTVSSLIHVSLYDMPYSDGAYPVVKIIVIAACLLFLLFAGYKAVKNIIDKQDMQGIAAAFLVSFIATISYVQHVILGSKFLEERFALFVFPLFIVAFIFLFSMAVSLSNGKKYIAGGAMLVIVAAGTVHLARAANVTYNYNWHYDADTKSMLADLQKVRGQAMDVRLGITWYYEPAINFYRTTRKMTWLMPVIRYGLGDDNNFIYVDTADARNFAGEPVLKTYNITGSRLIATR